MTIIDSIEELLWDPEVTEIMVDVPDSVRVERQGRIESAAVQFIDEQLSSVKIIDVIGEVFAWCKARSGIKELTKRRSSRTSYRYVFRLVDSELRRLEKSRAMLTRAQRAPISGSALLSGTQSWELSTSGSTRISRAEKG